MVPAGQLEPERGWYVLNRSGVARPTTIPDTSGIGLSGLPLRDPGHGRVTACGAIRVHISGGPGGHLPSASFAQPGTAVCGSCVGHWACGLGGICHLSDALGRGAPGSGPRRGPRQASPSLCGRRGPPAPQPPQSRYHMSPQHLRSQAACSQKSDRASRGAARKFREAPLELLSQPPHTSIPNTPSQNRASPCEIGYFPYTCRRTRSGKRRRGTVRQRRVDGLSDHPPNAGSHATRST